MNSSMDASTTVPFGKYKGLPVSVLASDRNYCDWLLAQPGIRERYQNICNIIINNFQVPQDTPEHNRLQKLFVNASIRQNILNTICNKLNNKLLNENSNVNFEVSGWDVIISGFKNQYIGCRYNIGPQDSCPDSCKVWPCGIDRILIELKPTIGDDYPVILRQMKSNILAFRRTYYGIGRIAVILIYEYFGCQYTTEREFKEIFLCEHILTFSRKEFSSLISIEGGEEE